LRGQSLRLSHKIVLTLVIFALGASGLVLAIRGATRQPSEKYPQDQDCAPAAVALQIRFPYRFDRLSRVLVPVPEAQARSVTNCRHFNFQFFLKTREVTGIHVFDGAGINWQNLYGLNGAGEKDIVVHVDHVQPATSLQYPTISTYRDFLSLDVRMLQWERAKFDGNRTPLAGYDLDRFRPQPRPWLTEFEDQSLFFLSRPEAAVELVGMCQLTLDRSRWESCRALAYSQQDALALSILFPHAELGQLNDMVERSLELIRKWRVPA
jgi:hypothetical protein